MHTDHTDDGRVVTELYADQLDGTHIGDDVTVTIGDRAFGGTLERVGQVFGFVSIQVDGTAFSLDPGKVVTLVERSLRTKILTQPNTEKRGELIDELHGRQSAAI